MVFNLQNTIHVINYVALAISITQGPSIKDVRTFLVIFDHPLPLSAAACILLSSISPCPCGHPVGKIFISKHSLKTPPFVSFFFVQIYLLPIRFILLRIVKIDMKTINNFFQNTVQFLTNFCVVYIVKWLKNMIKCQ